MQKVWLDENHRKCQTFQNQLTWLLIFEMKFVKFLYFSGGEFNAIIELLEGEHHFKFLVDGHWIHDPNQVCQLQITIQIYL